MKKLISILLILALSLSLFACDNDDGNTDDTDGKKNETNETEKSDLNYADTDEILALVKAAPVYAGVKYTTLKQISTVYNEETLTMEYGNFIKDKNGNIQAQIVDEEMTPSQTEAIIGDKHYIVYAGDPEVSENEANEDSTNYILAKYNDGYGYSLDQFEDIKAVINNDATYTLLCNSDEESVTSKIYDEMQSYVEMGFEGYESYKVSSVEYQLTVDKAGNIKAFVIMASVEVEMPEEEKKEGETELPVSLSNYASYLFVAAVEEFTGEVSVPTSDSVSAN